MGDEKNGNTKDSITPSDLAEIRGDIKVIKASTEIISEKIEHQDKLFSELFCQLRESNDKLSEHKTQNAEKLGELKKEQAEKIGELKEANAKEIGKIGKDFAEKLGDLKARQAYFAGGATVCAFILMWISKLLGF